MPATALDNEWSLLLAACSASSPPDHADRIRLLLKTPIRWKLLHELASRHGVQSLLYEAIKNIEDIPAHEMQALQQAYHTNLHKSLLLSRELIRILAHLSALGLDVMPYKGPALAEVIYGDIARRASGDIDLLIHPHDLRRVRDAVRDLSYTPHVLLSAAEESAYLKSGYELAFDGPGGPNLLELQWAILPRFYAVDFDIKALFERAITIAVAGQPTKTPSLEDLLLVLSVHAAKHLWGRLIWLCDLSRLINVPDLNWPWIGAQAQGLGIARILRIAMALSSALLGAEVPAAAQRCISEDPQSPKLAEKIQAQIIYETSPVAESLDYFRLMLRLREHASDRLRFLQRLAFTPGPSEWNAVRLPRPLFPLYRVVRVSRLAARLLRP